MTTETRNEAQPRDRLLSTIEAYTDRETAKSLAFAVTAAIGQTKAAERRATVEQVRALLHDRYRIDAEAGATIEEWDSILDELVASR